MQTIDWSAIPEERLNPLFSRKVLHSERMTLARVHLSDGCVLPEHAHENEQVCTVERGRLRFVINGAAHDIAAGQSLIIPPNFPHKVEALEDSIALDLFSPRREDWIRGDDAYLR